MLRWLNWMHNGPIVVLPRPLFTNFRSQCRRPYGPENSFSREHTLALCGGICRMKILWEVLYLVAERLVKISTLFGVVITAPFPPCFCESKDAEHRTECFVVKVNNNKRS